ncbi:hypothetical protein QBC32DRAFT_94088 [Pseudoneurospora amorphoporcata]|uniref:Uncharacterized protein n=1 Tax=Pseudoneurospora amorphoporcata TaxID=241081 RepID=A0AAN6NLU4_9PEZI|nr:hypothetical protein QBC32DRAFT_94088 [Pseudoneurospora amorphoporcata]
MEASSETLLLRGSEQQPDRVDDTPKPDTAQLARDHARLPWKPGFLRRFPFYGILPLLLSILCTGAATAVILLSNGKRVDEWSGFMQPGVLLAYTSTIANSLMGIAFAEAAVISFWTKAAAEPMPVKSAGQSIPPGRSAAVVLLVPCTD